MPLKYPKTHLSFNCQLYFLVLMFQINDFYFRNKIYFITKKFVLFN